MTDTSSQEYKTAFADFEAEFLKNPLEASLEDREELFCTFYNNHPEYTDPAILLIRLYRMREHHDKASQWISRVEAGELGTPFNSTLCTNELLFEKIFDACIYQGNRVLGSKYAMKYLNLPGSPNTGIIYNNLAYFSTDLSGCCLTSEKLDFNTKGITPQKGYFNSNTAFFQRRNGAQPILCVRHVNYTIDASSGTSTSEVYRTKNLIVRLDSGRSEWAECKFGTALETKATACFGLEDVRLIERPDGLIEFWGTQQEWCGDRINKMMCGELSLDPFLPPTFKSPKILEPPPEYDCGAEKNWIPFYGMSGSNQTPPEPQIIYCWSPFMVGTLDHTTPQSPTLQIQYTQTVPEIFRYMRGSSLLVPYGPTANHFCCVTHLSVEPPETPGARTYFHFIVFLKFQNEKLIITHFTEPFRFSGTGPGSPMIEYCIGFNISPRGQRLIGQFWFSTQDQTTNYMECPMDVFEKIRHSSAVTGA